MTTISTTPPAPPPPRKVKRRTIILTVTAVAVVAAVMLGAAVFFTLRSGLLDPARDAVEDTRALYQLEVDACLEDLPAPTSDDPQNLRPPKVVDCVSPGAEWVVDDVTQGVPVSVFEHYLSDEGALADSAAMCDTDPARLGYIYAVDEDTGETVTTYCLVLKPIGWRPKGT